jgi:diphthamide biosynthesis protein 3
MIPPIATAIIESNPQFASLHKHLTTNLLNPDGSTYAISQSHTSVSQSLHSYLLRIAKEELLRLSLRSVAAASDRNGKTDAFNITREAKESIGTISLILDEAPSLQLSEEDYDLLAPGIDAFHSSLGEVASVASKYLQRQHDLLCKLASAAYPTQDLSSTKHKANTKRFLNKNTSSHLAPSSLSVLLQPLLPTIPNPALHSSLASLADTTLQHASAHRALLTTTITHLERITHGLYARCTKARSAHLSAVAIALAKRIEMVYLQSRNRLYSVDVQEALGNYQSHLQSVEHELEERQRTLRKVLEEFDTVSLDGAGANAGNGQRGMMREVGRRYGEVLRETETVKDEIQKIENDGAAGKKSVIGRTGDIAKIGKG